MKDNMDNEELTLDEELTFDDEFDNTDVESMGALIASLKADFENKED